jgi:hypothetical protein
MDEGLWKPEITLGSSDDIPKRSPSYTRMQLAGRQDRFQGKRGDRFVARRALIVGLRVLTCRSLEEKVRLLSMVDFFESLVRQELVELAHRARDTHLEQGDVLGKPQQERSEELYVLKEGRVQLCMWWFPMVGR